MFVKAVGQQRGVSQAAVRDGMGQGRSLLAQDAVKANLADRTGTLDDVLEKYGAKKRVSGARAEAGATISASKPNPDDDEDDDMNENACSACKACSGSKACGCGASGCACACDACKACDFKNTTGKALANPPLNAEEKKTTEAVAGDYLAAIQHRRRQLALL
jgi:ClpP class serine protease